MHLLLFSMTNIYRVFQNLIFFAYTPYMTSRPKLCIDYVVKVELHLLCLIYIHFSWLITAWFTIDCISNPSTSSCYICLRTVPSNATCLWSTLHHRFLLAPQFQLQQCLTLAETMDYNKGRSTPIHCRPVILTPWKEIPCHDACHDDLQYPDQ